MLGYCFLSSGLCPHNGNTAQALSPAPTKPYYNKDFCLSHLHPRGRIFLTGCWKRRLNFITRPQCNDLRVTFLHSFSNASAPKWKQRRKTWITSLKNINIYSNCLSISAPKLKGKSSWGWYFWDIVNQEDLLPQLLQGSLWGTGEVQRLEPCRCGTRGFLSRHKARAWGSASGNWVAQKTGPNLELLEPNRLGVEFCLHYWLYNFSRGLKLLCLFSDL